MPGSDYKRQIPEHAKEAAVAIALMAIPVIHHFGGLLDRSGLADLYPA
jgi:hypothetical protein